MRKPEKEGSVKRTLISSLLVVAVAATLAAAAWSRPAAVKTLDGTVGPGFTISLKLAGKKVTKLKAGTYKLVVADKASIHNFVLEQEKGGKFEQQVTTVPFMGTKTVTVKLTRGQWKFFCKPHESFMFGTFTVS
jgi:plastocyanin